MLNTPKITATIVLFNENIEELSRTIDSFLKVPIAKKLYLVDNSPSDILKTKFNQSEVEYIFAGKNIGFASGHNLVIDKIENSSEYHLILNPDVTFEQDVIPNLISKLKVQKDLAMIAPKVLFPDGSHQYSCRRYPTLFELLVRRTGPLKKMFSSTINKGEYKDRDLNKPFCADFFQGCFMLFKTKDFVKVNGFDERYFLYMEDVDICRKIDTIDKKKLYYPKEQIIHYFKRGSSKKSSLFLIHLLSIVKYFYKWNFLKKK